MITKVPDYKSNDSDYYRVEIGFIEIGLIDKGCDEIDSASIYGYSEVSLIGWLSIEFVTVGSWVNFGDIELTGWETKDCDEIDSVSIYGYYEEAIGKI